MRVGLLFTVYRKYLLPEAALRLTSGKITQQFCEHINLIRVNKTVERVFLFIGFIFQRRYFACYAPFVGDE
jgi:hypothetical protein